MKSIGTIGKIVFAIPLFMFGFGHLSNAGAMKGMVPSYLPAAEFWVYLTGIALILSAISIIINKKTKLATLLLGVMLLLFAILIHLPGMMNGDQLSMAMFMKDLGLSGAAFFFSGNSKS
jgi:putative oxidoreductase